MNTDEKMNKIIEYYSCSDPHGESCDGNCSSCKEDLKKELLELVDIVKKEII